MISARHYFVIALGYPQTLLANNNHIFTVDRLKSLIDLSFDSAFGGFPSISVSLAPNGIMLAFADAEPDRILHFAESVRAQLNAENSTNRTATPICAAIAFGPMRNVDVLGYSSNFEGRPAIACARILSKLSAGQLAVEKSAWAFGDLSRELGPSTLIQGKRKGEEFSIRLHRRIIFALPYDEGTSARDLTSSSHDTPARGDPSRTDAEQSAPTQVVDSRRSKPPTVAANNRRMDVSGPLYTAIGLLPIGALQASTLLPASTREKLFRRTWERWFTSHGSSTSLDASLATLRILLQEYLLEVDDASTHNLSTRFLQYIGRVYGGDLAMAEVGLAVGVLTYLYSRKERWDTPSVPRTSEALGLVLDEKTMKVAADISLRILRLDERHRESHNS